MVAQSQQIEWLSLVETSGPFLTLTVLDQAFPQGLESIETPRRQQLRSAYSEWREAVDEDDELLPQLHDAWVNLVLTELLEFDEESAMPCSSLGAGAGAVSVSSPDGTAHYAPTWIIHAPGSTEPRAFVAVTRPDADLESAAQPDGWIASEVERMILLCREHGVRVGIVTNGESWVLINAPMDAPSGKAIWHSRFWFQEPATLKAFQSLLGVRRCFGPADQTLETLLDESLKHQEEVTDTLGEQVRRATEVLIQALDKADQDRNRELLHDVPPSLLYEASLTVMMRLVFVLCAEERGLLLLGDPVYDQNLAVSTLRGKLAEEADHLGDEVLERRFDAWARLLAAFRAVHAGIEHEDLRLPAMGGSLFDPDRFPFLEGRTLGTSWVDTVSKPLPIDNRTVLLLLNSLQVLEQSHGALALSYRALDVEQIGHVYEGLLDHTVVRVPDTTLGLKGSSKSRYPALSLASLESLRLEGHDALVAKVGEATGRTTASIRNEFTKPPSDAVLAAVLTSTNGDRVLSDRIKPFSNLLRSDAWGEPMIYRPQSFMVTVGADRRESGTHYTPRSLTEQIVNVALEPLVYTGPAEGHPRDQWTLKSPRTILDLKVCDPAMGSGAFLVQACRYLAERLVEAWSVAEASGRLVNADGDVVDARGTSDPLPMQADERLAVARGLVAERVLYGVDVNPLAVELSKLSIWLVTLAKDRPFTFLDHSLKSGNSLVGVQSLEEITQLRAKATAPRQPTIFGQALEETVERAVTLRLRLRSTVARGMDDVAEMEALHVSAQESLAVARLIGDSIVGQKLASKGSSRTLQRALSNLEIELELLLDGNNEVRTRVEQDTARSLSAGSAGDQALRPFHWPLEFPEVLTSGGRGFDAVVGNPPWASFSGRHAIPLDPRLDTYWANEFRSFTGWKTLHSLFIEQTLGLGAPHSSIGILVPAQVADLAGYAPIRQLVRAAKSVQEPLPYFGESAFAGVTQPSCALMAVGVPSDSEIESTDAPFLLAGARPAAEGGSSDDLSQAIRLLSECQRPPSDAFADPGIHTGNCSKKLIFAVPGAQGRFAQVREGKSVFPYRLNEPQKWLRVDYMPSDGEYFTVRDLSAYSQFPILLRQTAKRPIAAAHTSPTYFRNSVLACRGISGVATELVLAWLNSTATAVWHMIKVREANQGAFPQVKVRHLRDLPMPNWSDLERRLAKVGTELIRMAADEQSEAVSALDRAVSFALGLNEPQHEALLQELSGLLEGSQ